MNLKKTEQKQAFQWVASPDFFIINRIKPEYILCSTEFLQDKSFVAIENAIPETEMASQKTMLCVLFDFNFFRFAVFGKYGLVVARAISVVDRPSPLIVCKRNNSAHNVMA